MSKERYTQEEAMELLKDMISAKNAVLREVIKPINIRRFLKFCSDHCNLSYDNQMILYARKPDATHVAGKNAWKDKGRTIKDGEEPVYVFVDTVKCTDKGELALNDDGQELVLSDHGIPVYNKEPEYADFTMPVPVYDISQTEAGEEEEKQEEDKLPDFLDYVSCQPLVVVPVDKMDTQHKFMNAYYDPGNNEIVILQKLADLVYNQELMHSYVQYLFSNPDNLEKSPSAPDVRDSKYPDTAIECISWIINDHYNLKQTVKTFGNMTAMAEEEDSQIETELRIISYYSQRIIQHLDGFPLTFEETVLLNALMDDDRQLILEDFYGRMDTQYDIPDVVKSSIAHIFETIIYDLSDDERTKIYKDRLGKKIMTYPSYRLDPGRVLRQKKKKGADLGTIGDVEVDRDR